MRSLLVTGGAGFIGSGFVLESVRRGVEVIVLDKLTYAGHLENLDEAREAGKLRFIQGDIRDGKTVSELLSEFPVDAVVNFAAESHVDRSIDSPSAFIGTNIEGTFNLLDRSLEYWRELPADRKAGFRYLQVSTDEVFGELGPTGKFSEATPYAPSSPYSASKAAGDHLARAWHRTYGLPALVTNCTNNYGPRQFPEKLIPLMISNAVGGIALPVYGDGGNVRDWIHVEDHCRGLWLALEKGKPGETYCFGGAAERRNLDVVQEICRILDDLRPRSDGKPHSAGIEFVKDRPGHDWRYAMDDSKAARDLGYSRKFTFEAGLRSTVQWYLANSSWVESVLSKGDRE